MAGPAIRPYRAQDVAASVAFFDECAAQDASVRRVTAQGWEDFCGMSFNAGARDFLLMEEECGIVAFASSTGGAERPVACRHFRILVHPRARRRGLGTRLLRRIEVQDDPPTTLLQSNLVGKWGAGRAFAVKEGFLVTRSQLLMARAGPPPVQGPPPAGFELRAYRPGAEDDAAWRLLSEEGYGGQPDYAGLSAGDLERYRATPGFFLCLAEREGEVCGFCHVMEWQDEGLCVNSVVVTKSARGLGLGRALTVAGLGAAKGAKVSLNVLRGNAPAVAIYRGLGFEAYDELVTWQKPR